MTIEVAGSNPEEGETSRGSSTQNSLFPRGREVSSSNPEVVRIEKSRSREFESLQGDSNPSPLTQLVYDSIQFKCVTNEEIEGIEELLERVIGYRESNSGSSNWYITKV